MKKNKILLLNKNKMKIISIILFLFLINELECINNDDICKFHNNLTHLNCPSKFSFKCRKQFCTVNKSTCKKFALLSSYLAKFSNEYRSLVKDFGYFYSEEYFYSKIEYCPKNWSANQVCINTKKKCLYKPKIWAFVDVKKIKIKCACENLFSYKCGEEYCSKDKGSCFGFDIKKYKNKLKYCK